MKNYAKMVILLLAMTDVLMHAMDVEKVWIRTLVDNEDAELEKDSVSHIPFIKEQIIQGKGFSVNDPIVIPLDMKDFITMLYYSYPAYFKKYIRDGADVEELINVYKSAEKLEYYDLTSKVNEELTKRLGGG